MTNPPLPRVVVPRGNGCGDDIEALRAWPFGDPAEPLNPMFWLLSPQQFFAVLFWLTGYSTRPHVAVLIWGSLFRYVSPTTGEILLGQDELAEVTGVGMRDTPRVLRELVEIGALKRRLVRVRGVRGPGVARFYVNPACPEVIAPPEHSGEAGAKRSRRAHRVSGAPPTTPQHGAAQEQDPYWGELLAAADQVVRESEGKATARAVQRLAKVPRPIAMAVLEGAKQRARLLRCRGALPGEAPDAADVTSDAA